MVLLYSSGVMASLSLGPGGDLPWLTGNFALRHTCLGVLRVH